MICLSCGKDNPDTAAFCGSCGKKQEGTPRETKALQGNRKLPLPLIAGVLLVTVSAVCYLFLAHAGIAPSKRTKYSIEVASAIALPTSYTVTDLIDFDARNENVVINNQGQLAAIMYKSGNFGSKASQPHIYLWQNGKWMDSGTLSGYSGAEVIGISNQSQVLCEGVSLESSFRQPFIWQNGQITTIATNGADPKSSTTVVSMTGSGEVVGVTHGKIFKWQNGHSATITASIPAWPSSIQLGNAINNRGQVAGVAMKMNAGGRIDSATMTGFFWANGHTTMIDGLPGKSHTLPNWINNQGEIVGVACSHTDGGDEGDRAFLWESNATQDLGSLGGSHSRAFSINNSSYVVGEAETNLPKTQFHAFIWHSGHMTDLNSLLPSGSGWELFGAKSINDSGQIVAYGEHNGKETGVLLTPQ